MSERIMAPSGGPQQEIAVTILSTETQPPRHLNAGHWAELTEESGITPAIAAANFRTFGAPPYVDPERERLTLLAERFALQPQFVFVDAQYSTSDVYKSCIRFGWTALHGSGSNSFAHYPRGAKKAVSKYYSPAKTATVEGGIVTYIHWASDPVKDLGLATKAGRVG